MRYFVKQFHYLYKITNLIQNHKRYGHIYIGVRSSEIDPEFDIEYLGSNIQLKRTIKKYGQKNFKKRSWFS